MSGTELEQLKGRVDELQAQLHVVASIASLALRFASNRDLADEKVMQGLGYLQSTFSPEMSDSARFIAGEFGIFLQSLASDDRDALMALSIGRQNRSKGVS